MKKIFITIISVILGIIVGVKISERQDKKEIKKNHDMSEKHLALFLMMNQWVKVNQEGKHILEYFIKHNYKKIAVYGMSYVGETLVDELKDTDITVSYGIDKNADMVYSSVDVVRMEDELKPVDAIVVTTITFFDEIKKELNLKMNCPIISLEDILYEI